MKLQISKEGGVTARFAKKKKSSKKKTPEQREEARLQRQEARDRQKLEKATEYSKDLERAVKRQEGLKKQLDKALDGKSLGVPLSDLVVLAYQMIFNLEKKGIVLNAREKKILGMLEPYATRAAEKQTRMDRTILDI